MSEFKVRRHFSFPIPSGIVELAIPFPMNPEDFDMLMKAIELFKPGLIQKPTPNPADK